MLLQNVISMMHCHVLFEKLHSINGSVFMKLILCACNFHQISNKTGCKQTSSDIIFKNKKHQSKELKCIKPRVYSRVQGHVCVTTKRGKKVQ